MLSCQKKGLGTWRNYIVSEEDSFYLLPKNTGAVEIPKDPKHYTTVFEYKKEKNIKQDTEDLITYASIFSGPCTAYRMINDFVSLKEGDVIIQNGANSVVGQSVIQLAKLRGIKTISVIRERPDQAEIVERLKHVGGDIVVTEHYAGTHNMHRLISDLPKPKLALNCVGGDLRYMLKILENNGTLVTYGAMSRKPIQVTTSPFIFNNITMKGFWYSKWEDENGNSVEKKKMINEIINYSVSKQLTIFIQLNKFSEFQNALEQQYRPFPQRKLVLDMTN